MPARPPHHDILDILAEREQLAWYWTVLSTLSSWMQLVGYVILPPAFSLDVQSALATQLASVLLVMLGFFLSAFVYWMIANPKFRLESVALPNLGASFLGFFIIVYTVYREKTPSWTATSTPALFLALASILLYAVAASWAYLRVRDVKLHSDYLQKRNFYHAEQRDVELSPIPHALSPQEHSQPFHERRLSEEQTLFSRDIPLPPPEDETRLLEEDRTRNQLMRLLSDRSADTGDAALSRSTFHISLPVSPVSPNHEREHDQDMDSLYRPGYSSREARRQQIESGSLTKF